MSSFDFSNTAFKTAVSFITGTNKHLFITGKAGTGKTTFLKYVQSNSRKRMAVVAPTGVAAINAGGVTIHSFFQLPFGAFVPAGRHGWNGFESGINNRETLIKNLRLTSAKRDVIKELELLIIDEVSMVRADLMDAIDAVLRHVRRQPHHPFGGVQMVYIGDLFQLPPVVNNTEWEVLSEHYATPFFFNSKAVEQATPVYIELKKIYRQSDRIFIDLLNNIRNNCCTQQDLDTLHYYYKPGFQPTKEDKYITLTSHNSKADYINQAELNKAPGSPKKFEAIITGDFPDRAFPAEKDLYLKEGAQVMFIKNDKGEERRFYNGKLATVTRFKDDKIYVQFTSQENEMELEMEVWKNIRYNYNKEDDAIEEDELGTFSQYPIRLAWAITIHKSQGLTFEKAIIDAGASFAPGQVYVALSRLTSLNGLVLLSKILPSSISTDNRISSLSTNELEEEQVSKLLAAEQKNYMQYVVAKSFSWMKLLDEINHHLEAYSSRLIPSKEESIVWCKQLAFDAYAMQEVADKFIKRLDFLFTTCEADEYKQLQEKTAKASEWFIKELEEKLMRPLEKHIKEVRIKQKTKKYVRELQNLQMVVQRKMHQVKHAADLAFALRNQTNIHELLEIAEAGKKVKYTLVEPPNVVKEKVQKGDSSRMTLQLFKEGKTIDEIALARAMSPVTIQGHLATFILTGEVDILDLVTIEKLDKIIAVASDNMTHTMMKELLGTDISYGEIKAACNFIEYEKGINKVKAEA